MTFVDQIFYLQAVQLASLAQRTNGMNGPLKLSVASQFQWASHSRSFRCNGSARRLGRELRQQAEPPFRAVIEVGSLASPFSRYCLKLERSKTGGGLPYFNCIQYPFTMPKPAASKFFWDSPRKNKRNDRSSHARRDKIRAL